MRHSVLLLQITAMMLLPTVVANSRAQPSGRSTLPKVDLPAKKSSYAELEREIKALKPKNVPWREIKWRVSLVDGIHESRRQKKPIICWVFIDRPIDDERC